MLPNRNSKLRRAATAIVLGGLGPVAVAQSPAEVSVYAAGSLRAALTDVGKAYEACRPGLALTPDTLVQRLLDPAVRVGTSTPKADPSGDYAWQMFERIEKPGVANALATLSGKALQLTGGPNSPPPAKNRNVYGMLVGDGAADVSVTCCTNAVLARQGFSAP